MSEVVSVDVALKRLRDKEKWPFKDTDSGHEIYENRYYGFFDCGGVFNKDGAGDKEKLIQEIKRDFDEPQPDLIGIKPEDLGYYAVTVLSGRDYIDRLYELSCYREEVFNEEFGFWATQASA